MPDKPLKTHPLKEGDTRAKPESELMPRERREKRAAELLLKVQALGQPGGQSSGDELPAPTTAKAKLRCFVECMVAHGVAPFLRRVLIDAGEGCRSSVRSQLACSRAVVPTRALCTSASADLCTKPRAWSLSPTCLPASTCSLPTGS